MLYGSPYGRYGEAAFGGSTSPKDGGSAVSGPSDDVIALRHLRAGGGDCFGRLIARWSSFMHVSVYLEAESPCQFPVFQTTHFGALVRLLFHELLGLQLRRLLRWSSIGARSRRARGVLPFVFTLIRAVDQNQKELTIRSRVWCVLLSPLGWHDYVVWHDNVGMIES